MDTNEQGFVKVTDITVIDIPMNGTRILAPSIFKSILRSSYMFNTDNLCALEVEAEELVKIQTHLKFSVTLCYMYHCLKRYEKKYSK